MVPKSDSDRLEESGGVRKREERHPAYTDTPCGTKKKWGLLVLPVKGLGER